MKEAFGFCFKTSLLKGTTGFLLVDEIEKCKKPIEAVCGEGNFTFIGDYNCMSDERLIRQVDKNFLQENVIHFVSYTNIEDEEIAKEIQLKIPVESKLFKFDNYQL